jgi:putative ABC transport system ATP-binding protein
MQRVAIARALANDPQILLADEPTGNLDTKTGEQIMVLLEELNRQGKTIIMVTHEAHVAAYAQKRLHMKDGMIERIQEATLMRQARFIRNLSLGIENLCDSTSSVPP